jgi:predicted NUDIX family NTP pyrophosphohydrolase
VAGLTSNTFSMEWPPRSGRRQEFPEVDRAEWFAPEIAREKLLAAQAPLLEQLLALLGNRAPRQATEERAAAPLSLF